LYQNDTIIALATPSGAGAIAVIRLSGSKAIAMVDASFKSISTKKLVSQKTHTIHLGHIVEDSRVLDEVLVSVFKTLSPILGRMSLKFHAMEVLIYNKKLYNYLYAMVRVLQTQGSSRFVLS
jgi:tRNA modification GTPase